MKVVVLILGVLAVLLGGFWTVQGLDLVTVEPLLCASACETIEGPSASWTLIGLLMAGIGGVGIGYGLKRRPRSAD